MGKGRPRYVEKVGLGQSSSVISSNSINIPSAPVYYPNEEEFKDPLDFIYKIRPEAEKYGICKIVPPKSWKPPFALDLDSFTFPTKTQEIHRLQVRPASCDSKTFELEYTRFLEEFGGKKVVKKKVVFEGAELDLCRLFNAVKRFGGYDRVVKDKKWGEVVRFVRSAKKISDCAKHVLCQLYREHLYDYEVYCSRLNKDGDKNCRRLVHSDIKCERQSDLLSLKRKGKNRRGGRVEVVKAKAEEYDQICEQCRSGLHGEVMLLCDRCNKGWHLYCLSPPLKRIPPGNWYCLECLNSEKDCFGFIPGKQISLEAFRRVADRAKKKWFGSASTSRVQLEKKFWEIVEGSAGELEVKYGSDLDTSVYGSGFPRVQDQRPESIGAGIWDEYCVSPWNLNNLPKLQGSMLRAVHHSIAGVMVPWLYIGMLFSSFCWHFEDHCFYSMNYLHWGEPKCWYSVPGSEAGAFEKVMRNTLPDLFDAQPDLLFQLVTMLNPSVLQESNVPVYSVLQEPGNFVITFPRSYHGGFNFGLNCAEAVNFAPADWLSHGGYGADLYRLYRKAAVLSHEELICVVAKTTFDSKVTPYLRKELLRIYDKEKTWRERLWRDGIVSSSPMSPREQPKYVGVEEDPTCIICQQFLYLSAVTCNCRPSAFVCLEHWEHLCECKANERRLLYRHSLAELNDLILDAEIHNSEETIHNRNAQKQMLSSHNLGALSKKIKGGHVTHVQLAEEWLMRSCRIFQKPYSSDTFANALKDAEQFLWAGSEMDPVRDMTRKLIEAQNWAEGIRDCVSKLESWSDNRKHGMERVQMKCALNLLSFDPAPCNEPGCVKLKGYIQEAELLIQEINSAMSRSDVSIVEWEILNAKACDLGIFVEESEKLSHKLCFVKAWIDSVRKCIAEKSPAMVEVDTLEKLKLEVSELQVQIPEIELLGDLSRQGESCQYRCNEMLKGSINLKNLELFLREMDGFTINIPELRLLRQYHSDAMSWISRFNDVVRSVGERDDLESVVDELTCMKNSGTLLQIQVDELFHVDIELQKACCRVKALEVVLRTKQTNKLFVKLFDFLSPFLVALRGKLSLDSIQQVLKEAAILQIEEEKLFADLSGALAVALSWENKAKIILSSEGQMSDFEDLLRNSEDVCVMLPSLSDVKEAVSMAMSWLNMSKSFLRSYSSVPLPSDYLLNLESLKELVSQSKLIKISLGEKSMLQTILDNCSQWELDACSLLNDTECVLHTNDIRGGSTTSLVSRIEHQIASLDCVINSGLCLQFDFVVTSKLKDACSTLRRCLKALSFYNVAPTIEEVEMILEVGAHLPATYAHCSLWNLLVDDVNWLKKSLEIVSRCNFRRYKLTDAEEVLGKSQILNGSFPVVVGQLVNAIKKHKLWLEQAKQFFSDSENRSWLLLLQLKDHAQDLGSTNAFSCLELDLVFAEVEMIETWKCNCKDVVVSDQNVHSLLDTLSEIKCTLDRSLRIYDKSMGCEPKRWCIYCSCEKDQMVLTCSICNDCYHLECINQTGQTPGDLNDSVKCICPCCDFIKSGTTAYSGSGSLKTRKKYPELSKLVEALSDADCFRVRIEERDVLQQIVEKAHECNSRLTEVVDFVLEHLDEDLDIAATKLSTALKAVYTSEVYNSHGHCKLEMALARNSWRVRACKLLEGSRKPRMPQIMRHLKEGSTISIPSGDHFRQKLAEVKHNGMQWIEKAKKVSLDSGAVGLDKVFELILEGKNLVIDVEKELELLRDRSMLYCICRKPYDKRAMIACDKCDEWYHFDCIMLTSQPKFYICPACKLETEEDLSTSSPTTHERATNKCEEPHTPSPWQRNSRRKMQQHESRSRKRSKVEESDNSSMSRLPSGIGIGSLIWRKRKPFRRVVRRREDLNILFSLFYVQQEQL